MYKEKLKKKKTGKLQMKKISKSIEENRFILEIFAYRRK